MRRLMWFSIGFGAACVLGAYVYPSEFLLYGAFAFLFGVAFLIGSRWSRFLRIPAVCFTALAIGIGWFAFYDSIYLAPVRSLDAQILETELEVSDYSYSTDYGTGVSAKLTVDDKQYDAVVYLNETVLCEPGDTLYGTFRFRFTAEGGSKDPTYHRSEGIFLLAYQSGEVVLIEAESVPARYYPAVLRKQITKRIEALFPADAAAFAKALLLGDRSGIDYETNTAFKLSGISHIVAVSGLHVSILFGMVYLFSGRKRLLMCLLGFPVLALFAAVTGFTPSVTRACIMQALMLLAVLTNREYDPPTALAFAALVMMAVNPMVVISVSFQLSVGCMVGIFLFSGKIHDWILDEKRLGSGKGKGIKARSKRWFAGSVSVSMSASVITTPLVAYYFGTVSLISLLTNLLVVWLVSYIFYGIMLACCVSLLGMLAGRVIAWLTILPIRLVLGVSGALAKFPLAAVYTESDYIVAWLVFVYLLLAVYLCMKQKPAVVFACLSAICLCAALIASWVEPLTDECRVTVLDVGQGQCILLQSEGKTFLVDCGGSSATESADLAAQTLLSQGVSSLDGMIVTHYDEDHAGGIPYLLTRIPADTIYLPNIADENGIGAQIRNLAGERAAVVSDDIRLTYGSTSVTIIGPESYNLSNESSLCVLFQTEKCDILITGDRGQLGEMLLLQRTDLPELEVLIAGHHGSAGSTGEALLAETSPEYVLISAGKNNRYGHPAETLLERLEQFGCIIFRTDLNGTIIYRG